MSLNDKIFSEVFCALRQWPLFQCTEANNSCYSFFVEEKWSVNLVRVQWPSNFSADVPLVYFSFLILSNCDETCNFRFWKWFHHRTQDETSTPTYVQFLISQLYFLIIFCNFLNSLQHVGSIIADFCSNTFQIVGYSTPYTWPALAADGKWAVYTYTSILPGIGMHMGSAGYSQACPSLSDNCILCLIF